MSRIFISGSSTGLGMMAARLLDSQDHEVVLHARSDARASDAHRELPRAKAIVTGDVETIAGAKEVAAKVNALGRFDAVMHNAAVGYREGHRDALFISSVQAHLTRIPPRPPLPVACDGQNCSQIVLTRLSESSVFSRTWLCRLAP